MEHHDVVVVGAGPAGLATAASLHARGVFPLVLDRSDGVGAAWRTRRYDRLRLHTVRWLSHLPGYRIPRSYGKWVSATGMVEYLESYARRHGIRPRFGSEVERVDESNGGWSLATGPGRVVSRYVVLATGSSNEPHVPDWPGRERFGGELVHSADYRNAAPFAGESVLVVGSGNSGAEIAVDLVEGGARRVRLAVRTPPNIVRRDRLGVPTQLLGIAISRLPPSAKNPLARALRRISVPDLAPYGLVSPPRPFDLFEWTATVPIVDVGFVDAVRRGDVEIVAAVEAFDDDGRVILADGRRIAADAVVAATGYRTGLARLVGHLGVLDERERPVVHGAESHPAAPGLYFVGIGVELGGLLRRIRFDARAAAAAIATRLGRERPGTS